MNSHNNMIHNPRHQVKDGKGKVGVGPIR